MFLFLFILVYDAYRLVMADSSQRGFMVRLMVSSCMLVGGCRVQILGAQTQLYFGQGRFVLVMIRMLLGLSASCVPPLRLHASLPRNYDCLFSLMSTTCLGRRPSAAMSDG